MNHSDVVLQHLTTMCTGIHRYLTNPCQQELVRVINEREKIEAKKEAKIKARSLKAAGSKEIQQSWPTIAASGFSKCK